MHAALWAPAAFFYEMARDEPLLAGMASAGFFPFVERSLGENGQPGRKLPG